MNEVEPERHEKSAFMGFMTRKRSCSHRQTEGQELEGENFNPLWENEEFLILLLDWDVIICIL